MINFSHKKAQSLIEYGLILALVAIIALTVLSKLGGSVTNVGNRTSTQVENISESALTKYCDSITDADAKQKCIDNIPSDGGGTED